MNVLETKRLILRLLKTSDIDQLYPILSDPEVMRYYPHPLNLEESVEWIARSVRSYEKYGHAFYACIHKQSQKLIGICGLVPPYFEEDGFVEVGCLLDKRFWKQGFASEATYACWDYGFSHFQFDQIAGIMDPQNTASICIVEKNGLTFKGTTQRFNKTMHIYTITKEVWEANAYSRAG